MAKATLTTTSNLLCSQLTEDAFRRWASDLPGALRKAEAVGKQIVEPVVYEPTQAEQLACTEPVVDEVLAEARRHAAADFARANVQKAVAHLSTIRAGAERLSSRRCWGLSASCKVCGMRWSEKVVDLDDADVVIARLVATIEYTHRETQSFGNRHWCSQCPAEDKLIDGLTVRECLQRYQALQQWADGKAEYLNIDGTTSPVPLSRIKEWMKAYEMTGAQKEAARSAWSAALRAKQQEARTKERYRVVVDCQDEP